MEEIIKAWKGWRIEFAQWYGSDWDGAAEYSSYTSYDWSEDDIATLLARHPKGKEFPWLRYIHRGYSYIYIVSATADEIQIHFTDSCTHSLSKEKDSYSYNYCFGHGNYRNTLRLLPPGIKQAEIKKYENR